MKQVLSFTVFSTLLLLSLSSCDKDPVIENQEELITSLYVVLTPKDGPGDIVNWSFIDLDGDGGLPPVYSVQPLKPNQVYSIALRLANESESPAEDITSEILEEAEDHQFFYELTKPLSDFTNIAYTDKDADGNPIGLMATIESLETGSGSMKITLRHQPDKNADKVAQGDITNAGGETDIEVSFDIEFKN